MLTALILLSLDVCISGDLYICRLPRFYFPLMCVFQAPLYMLTVLILLSLGVCISGDV